MGEVVNVIVAFAVIVVIFRWATSSNDSPTDQSASASLGFRPKNVTQDMVDLIHNMFPDIPADNIRYDLLRTGNVELTSNKILEKGFLPAPPPAYFTIYPRSAAQTPSSSTTTTTSGTSTSTKPKETLISRYGLDSRIASSPLSSSSSAPHNQTTPQTEMETEMDVGGKAVWEDTPEKREASLKERKARMILAARQRMLAQQQQSQSTAQAAKS